MQSTQRETEDWYRKYYAAKGKDRNDVLSNPGVLFQQLAFEASVISALRRASLERESAQVLDVGCGAGNSLARFLQLGFTPGNLHGIDVFPARIEEARARYPNLHFRCDDATALPYAAESFDLVLESTMFVQITDDGLAGRIATEMVRVTKPGGYLLLIDWRYARPGDPSYKAVSRSRIRGLFCAGGAASILYSSPGALLPPIGRFASRYLPSAYFSLRALAPFLAAQMATLLQKRPA